MIKISVFCPLYNATSYIHSLIDGIFSQEQVEIENVVFAVTESTDNTLEIVKEYSQKNEKISYFECLRKEFSHSGIREKGIFSCSSNVVIMITQDVNIFDKLSFFNLANSIDNKVIFAFGKQISKYKGIEKYIREINYPDRDYIMDTSKIKEYQIKTFFASDAFSAYNRQKFIELGGYDNKRLMMNEDMYYAHKIILSGYCLKYVSSAVVEHSHKFTLRQLYKRYFDTGVFFKENREFQNYKSTNSGFSLAKKVLGKILKNFDIKSLCRFVPDMAARYIGMKKGEKQ